MSCWRGPIEMGTCVNCGNDEIAMENLTEYHLCPACHEADMIEHKVTQLQIVAIRGALDLLNTDYNTLAGEALEIHPQRVPIMKNLSYKQASLIVLYSNKKFRKSGKIT